MPRLRSSISVGVISALSSLAIAQIPAANRTPVLVELFTSEGCSSCPPADALLEKLDRDQPIDGVDIIALGEHVDYWDNLGWHDRFSSHQYTERQGQYSSRLGVDGVYTPQMIVDGADQFVGNDAAHARQSIQHAAQRSKLPLELARPVLDGNSISSSLSSTGLVQTSQAQGEIYAALVDDNDSTDVRNGENGGRRLHHVAVVRTLQRIGTLRDLGRTGIPFNLNLPPGANSARMRLVAFIQQEDQGAIIGAVSTEVNP